MSDQPPTDVVPTHAMVWTYDGDYSRVEAVCHAESDADCRLEPVNRDECECEYWGRIVRKDDGTIWHESHENYYTDWDNASDAPVLHQVKPGGSCNVALTINESGCAEELSVPGTSMTLATVPFEPVWDDDQCLWSPCKPPGVRDRGDQ